MRVTWTPSSPSPGVGRLRGGSGEVGIPAGGLLAALACGRLVRWPRKEGLWLRSGLRDKSQASRFPRTWAGHPGEIGFSSMGGGRQAGSPPPRRRGGGRSPTGRIARRSAAHPVRLPRKWIWLLRIQPRFQVFSRPGPACSRLSPVPPPNAARPLPLSAASLAKFAERR